VHAEPGPKRLAGDCEAYQMRAVLRRPKGRAEDCPSYQSAYVFSFTLDRGKLDLALGENAEQRPA
jgi:hypothetical protein